MFDHRDKQLTDLETAYTACMETMRSLSAENFLKSLGDWTARDIAAHFIGWNRITLAGCSELREGVEPFYFYDGTNDYRKVNARFFEQFPSSDREGLLKEIAVTKDALMDYLKTIPESEWELDTGMSIIGVTPQPWHAVLIRLSAITENTGRKLWMHT